MNSTQATLDFAVCSGVRIEIFPLAFSMHQLPRIYPCPACTLSATFSALFAMTMNLQLKHVWKGNQHLIDLGKLASPAITLQKDTNPHANGEAN
jgi:hypothetical protein